MKKRFQFMIVAGALCLACFGCGKKEAVNDTAVQDVTEVVETTTEATTEVIIEATTEVTTEATTEEMSQESDTGNVKVGDKVTLGRYEQDNDFDNESEPLVWRVLAIEDGAAIMITDEGIDCQKFHEFFNETIEWENSDIRYWLNMNFFNSAFSEEEAQMIVDNSMGDRVSMLTAEEASAYFSSDNDRICHITTYAAFLGAGQTDGEESEFLPEYSSWWLRSPGFMGGWVAYVTSSGTVVTDQGDPANFANNAVRPVIRMKVSQAAAE